MPEKEVRLIDANALEKALEEIKIPVAVAKGKMFRLIKEAPTIDTESLRPKGKWIEREDYNFDTYYDCSVCGESFCLIEGVPEENSFHYCPNCGAKMEE